MSISDAKPLITVALPVFNGGRHLRLAVESILLQDFDNWELLILDDGSTDGSMESLKTLQDPRIQIIRDGQRKGLASRLNEGIDRANGLYFARMDHDDIAYPERFSSQLSMLEGNPKLDLVATGAVTISGDNQLLGALPTDSNPEKIVSKPWKGFYLYHPTWMGKTSWFRKFRYSEPAPFRCEDQELLLRSYHCSCFTVIQKPLLAYRVRERIEWKLLLKTRWAFFRVQQQYFTAKRQYGFAFLSLLVFFGRLILDISKPGIKYFRTYRVDEEQERRWQSVLRSLRELPQ